MYQGIVSAKGRDVRKLSVGLGGFKLTGLSNENKCELAVSPCSEVDSRTHQEGGDLCKLRGKTVGLEVAEVKRE